jgi:ATP-dependent DNA helicase RecG
MLSFDELWERLNAYDETVEIEAKHGSRVGDAALETISAFCNEPYRGGGYLIFGVREKPGALFPDYEIVGVPNPGQLLNDLASRANTEFNHQIRPEIWQEQRGGKVVVIAFIAEAPAQQKPVFIKKKGSQHGAFRRIGGSDVHCSEEDLAGFYQEQGHQSYDETVVKDATLDDLDPEALEEYRRLRREQDPSAPELGYTDQDLLYSLHAATRQEGRLVPTIAGLLLFGKRIALRRFFPMMRVDYIRVPGREWVPDPEARYQGVEIRDPLLRAIPRAIGQILEDLLTGFHLPAGQDRRQDVPLIPRDAIREVVVNAVMHRNYRVQGPVQIIRYANRLEIRNPGISLIPDERLGEPGSRTRNRQVAAVLHETRYAETKGTGIRAVRELMHQHSLVPPFFESDRAKDTFTVTLLFHHFLSQEDLAWLDRFRDFQLPPDEQKALIFVREVGAINNAAYRDINGAETLESTYRLRRLRDLGLLEQRGQSRATYYVPTSRFVDLSQGVMADQSSDPAGKSSELPPISSEQLTRSSELAALPTDLVAEIEAIGGKAPEERIRGLLLRVCAVRPLTAESLGLLFGRRPVYLRHRYLRRLIDEGRMEYTIPSQPTHPLQAYRTVPQPGEKGESDDPEAT